MAVTQYTWQIAADPAAVIAAPVTQSPLDRVINLGRNAHLGNGLIRPFRRDKKNDFANAAGLALVRSAVGQVLGTKAASDFTQGELPWNTEFGSIVFLLRHQNNDDVLQELGRAYVIEALQRWEPRVIIRDARISREKSPDGQETTLVITLVYDVTTGTTAGNQVVLPNVESVFQVAA